ncbi:MAG: hypothetical protein WAQ52_00115 [Terriglobales bacterium]
MPLEHGEELQGKCLILTVPALPAVFLECAHHENIDKVQRLFRHFIEGVALDEKYVFVSEVHSEQENMALAFEKGR